MTTNPLMARFAGTPALVDQAMGERFQSCLTQAAAHPDFAKLGEIAASEDFWPEPDSWAARYRPYVVKDGILQIPVKGVLLHDFPYALGDWATGYDYIWQAFKRGCGDFVTGEIQGIALMCDTPGGMVAGCFDAVDKMVGLKEQVGVPVRGFAHEMAYSAGYAIISAADHIAVSRTGGVGSIGVVTSHVDLSGMYDQMGVKITFIHAGKHKVDGNATQPLPDDVKERIQARIDELYDVFVSAVARNRGMEEEAVRATEALTFTATQAVSNGLADSIGSLDDAVAAFAAELSSTSGDETMSTQDNAATVEQAVHEKAVADAKAEGVREGATAERGRINAILACENAKERPAAALAAALDTDMTVEQANSFLGKLSVEKAETPAPAAPAATQTPFDAAMQNGNPEIGANVQPGSEEAREDDASDVLALAERCGIKGFAKPARQ